MNKQRVTIRIDDAHELSIINYEIHGDNKIINKAEVAIMNPEGVAQDTVTGIYDVHALLDYLNHYFGDRK